MTLREWKRISPHFRSNRQGRRQNRQNVDEGNDLPVSRGFPPKTNSKVRQTFYFRFVRFRTSSFSLPFKFCLLLSPATILFASFFFLTSNSCCHLSPLLLLLVLLPVPSVPPIHLLHFCHFGKFHFFEMNKIWKRLSLRMEGWQRTSSFLSFFCRFIFLRPGPGLRD